MTVTDFLPQLFAHMGIEGVQIHTDETDESLTINIIVPEEDSGMVIGRRGETLDALQKVVRLAFQKDGDKPIMLNVNQFREQREEYVVSLASRIAAQVESTGRSYTLRLPSFERRLVHMTLAENPHVSTHSEGEGIDRVLIIEPKEVA